MIKNYFVSAIRNLGRNKVFSLINVFGLAIGISASLVIFLIVHYDFSFDRFEKDGDRIYRIVSDYAEQGEPGHTRGTQGPLVDAVRNEVTGPEEVAAFRYFNVEKTMIPSTQKPFKNQKGIVFADRHYFNLIPYTWVAGSQGSALSTPGKVVLTEKRARMYFPSLRFSDVVGQKIVYADSIQAIVSGVVKDLDEKGNTDFAFEEFISLPTILDSKSIRNSFYWDQWGSTTSDQQLYIRLHPGIKAASVEAQLKTIFEKYQGKSEKDNHFSWTYKLQPLSDQHFNAYYGLLTQGVANKPTLRGLMLVAGFLLFLGCINFINLTTAQASQRAREIGIRKTLGSSKKQLVAQLLSETFLITVSATLLSLALVPLLLKVFAGFIPTGVHFSLAFIAHQPGLLIFLAALVLVVSFLAGLYPALVLSAWRPVQVLKSQGSVDGGKTRNVRVRQVLTVSQFIVAQAFIMGTLLVSKQIRYMLDKDLGFKKEAILSFGTPDSDTSYAKRLFLLHELREIPGIALISLASDVPASGGTWATTMKYKGVKGDQDNDIELKAGDTNYLRLFQIPLLAGRNIVASDTIKEILINENYLHLLGFQHPADVLGKTVYWNNKETPIVGVMKDFHAHALSSVVKPLAFIFDASYAKQVVVSLQPQSRDGAQWKTAIAGMGKAFKKVYPEEDFDYAFLDQSIKDFYQTELNISNLLMWATALTIFISCLGLLGLVIYTTNRRTKEIGVRKVLGASVTQIVSTLSKDFLKLVILGFALATPAAWWAVQNWLEKFPFRTSVSWWVFALSGLAMIGFAMVTLSVQTIRAARANPVKSLRTE
jgi:putative ABC transport system permease protein